MLINQLWWRFSHEYIGNQQDVEYHIIADESHFAHVVVLNSLWKYKKRSAAFGASREKTIYTQFEYSIWSWP
jgi:hypothetical protein